MRTSPKLNNHRQYGICIHSVQKRSNELARLWHLFSGMRRAFILIDCLKKCHTISSDYYIDLLDQLKDQITKKRSHLQKKTESAVSSRQCTLPQINQSNGEIVRIRI
ncbi:hypothetical protein HHI36_013785 [Cryptolaemus montrouzieri]|uniref:Uncharacterized protein n=1 Tax=Cryptolaemus montrouzieri TaxID=559131 RepID=A0ABD2NJ93_9CUCU